MTLPGLPAGTWLVSDSKPLTRERIEAAYKPCKYCGTEEDLIHMTVSRGGQVDDTYNICQFCLEKGADLESERRVTDTGATGGGP